MMGPGEVLVRDEAGLESLLEEVAVRIARDRRTDAPMRLVGIRTRGVPIARRLAQRLGGLVGAAVPVGAVDITFYRDDLNQADHWPVLHGTEIPFGIDGAEIVLVDDVLFTGRTVRAALNAICDLGRPAAVRLAVVVDRGHREIPIQADVVGLALPTAPGDRVVVRVHPVDAVEEIVRLNKPAAQARGMSG
jgi:pyrimidine operon attenuation protein / uracil phosphoribosyltransferase